MFCTFGKPKKLKRFYNMLIIVVFSSILFTGYAVSNPVKVIQSSIKVMQFVQFRYVKTTQNKIQIMNLDCDHVIFSKYVRTKISQTLIET